MAYLLYLAVVPVPPSEEIPALRAYLEQAFPHGENRAYLDGLCGSPLPRVTVQRLGALSLLPSLLRAADIDSASLILRRDGQGRPYCEASKGILPFRGLTETHAPFDFNLSHTHAHVAAALMVGEGRVGVDVEEPIPPARALPLIRRYCTEGELALLEGLPDDGDLAACFFTSTWVEREAIAKQEGGGMPLRFDTAALPDGVTLWSGHLPGSETAVALCAPLKNAPSAPRILPDSLPVRFS